MLLYKLEAFLLPFRQVTKKIKIPSSALRSESKNNIFVKSIANLKLLPIDTYYYLLDTANYCTILCILIW